VEVAIWGSPQSSLACIGFPLLRWWVSGSFQFSNLKKKEIDNAF
jgi:hypothetical protein